MIKLCVVLLFTSMVFLVQAENLAAPGADIKKEKTWWQKRQHKEDLNYPHKIHMKTMLDEGDSCMLCHPFSSNLEPDEKKLNSLRKINNEPLKAICHSCHVEKMNAPSACRLCHNDVSTIWPENHNYNYIKRHADDARTDQAGCSACHQSLSFCTACHFKRNYSSEFMANNVHKLAYKTLHGIDARMAPAECASCHQVNYCSDCHRQKRPR